jgi:hypothetical protein
MFLIKINCFLGVLVLFSTSMEHQDFQLKNMIVVILFDILCEFFDFFPSWDRRRLLILDDFLRFLYSETELWSERLYNFAFRKDKFKNSVKIEEYNYELYLTKIHYGEDVIQNELMAIQSKKTDFLRTLAQNEMLIQSDKNLLPYFYAMKISLMIYWLIGQEFVLNTIYSIAYSLLWTVLDNINNSMYLVKHTPMCARTGKCPIDLEVINAYEPMQDLTPGFVIPTWIFIIFVLPPFIGWIMTEPEGRKKAKGP